LGELSYRRPSGLPAAVDRYDNCPPTQQYSADELWITELFQAGSSGFFFRFPKMNAIAMLMM